LTPLSPPQTLSVAIITKNEETNLARTLSSVQFADEIVILDSASTDRTTEIARSFNAGSSTKTGRVSPDRRTRH